MLHRGARQDPVSKIENVRPVAPSLDQSVNLIRKQLSACKQGQWVKRSLDRFDCLNILSEVERR